MILIPIREQIPEGTRLSQQDEQDLLPYIEEGGNVVFYVKRGPNPQELCLTLCRKNDEIIARGSYFIGMDWISVNNAAIQVFPKMNYDNFEVDYVRMLNDALSESENYNHLQDLVTIHFDKPSMKVQQQQDLLSVFLITEYLNILQRIVVKGLKKSFYTIEENLHNKIKGRILVGRNIRNNIVKGRITDNVCKYQVYGIDSPENRILKLALRFCARQLGVYRHAFNTDLLDKKVRFIRPYFEYVSDNVNLKTVKSYKGNPVYKDYMQAIEFAQILLRRYSYDITVVGNKEVQTPPFWIDMSKLFELYIFHHLRRIFIGKGEIRYHVNAHYQELDYLLNPEFWKNPYVIDAKYKLGYKNNSISKDDAREVAGYARLTKVYDELGLDPDQSLPIKCLIIYPDQTQQEFFTFNRQEEPEFQIIAGYARFYKIGIKLPTINKDTVSQTGFVR